jgi:hypothetical protein
VATSPLAPGLGIAKGNALGINLAQRSQQRLDALPVELKQDLLKGFEAERSHLNAVRQQTENSLKSHSSTKAQTTLESLNDRFLALAHNTQYVTSSILEADPSKAPIPGGPIAQLETYKPEYLLPTLNPTFVICKEGIWNKSGFPYQSQLDKNSDSLRKISLAVGLFKSYSQKNKPGLPGITDLVLSAAGTGIAIGTDLVLTNQHVVANMVVDPAAAPSSWQLDTAKQRFIIWFPIETSACASMANSMAFEVVQIAYAGLGPTYDDDIAVLRVQPLNGGSLQPIAFAEATSYPGNLYLGVVGYPDRPDAADYVPPSGNGLFPSDVELEAYFDLPNGQLPKYQVERLGFGTLVDLNDPENRIIGHDAPTDNSSSGSLVVSLDTGEPIALHAGGNLGAGIRSGVNIAYRGDYIVAQLRGHGLLTPIK